MNNESWIRVVRTPYEEPHHTHLVIAASNGAFSGATDLYCGVSTLIEIGKALGRFPSRVPDEYEFAYGSPNPADRSYRFLRLRARTVDAAGHCSLQFEFDLNRQPPSEGRAAFSIDVEPWAIEQLGRAFEKLHDDPDGSFYWTPLDGFG